MLLLVWQLRHLSCLPSAGLSGTEHVSRPASALHLRAGLLESDQVQVYGLRPNGLQKLDMGLGCVSRNSAHEGATGHPGTEQMDGLLPFQ